MAGINNNYTYLSSLIGSIFEKEERIKIFGLNPSSRAFLISAIIKKLDRTAVIITSDIKSAKSFLSDIKFFWGEEKQSGPSTKDQRVIFYPPGEVFSQDETLPPQDTAGQRMEVLFRLHSLYSPSIIVTTDLALTQKVISGEGLPSSVNQLIQGEEIDRDKFQKTLIKRGYQRVSLVEEKGEFSVRGGILDIFPPLYRQPLRIEFFGDEIESIRSFDSVTQRSKLLLDDIMIIPFREPVSSPQLENFHDYLPSNCIFFIDDLSKIDNNGYQEMITGILDKFPLVSFGELDIFSSPEKEEKSFRFSIDTNENIRREIVSSQSGEGMLSPLIKKMNGWLEEGIIVSLVCPTPREADQLLELLEGYSLKVDRESGSFSWKGGEPERLTSVKIWTGELSSGFRLISEKLVFITEDEIFGEKIRKRKTARKKGYLISSLGDLKVNDYIVHSDFGIGAYRGLKRLVLDGGIEKDFLHLVYRDDDKLYLPVERLNVIQKYIGAPGYAPIPDKLGGTSWSRMKKKVRESIREMAEELLKIYAFRQIRNGISFSGQDSHYKEFEAAFEYEETEDQQKAIDSVLMDLESNRPMDRLICGDVGYGKTEVAMRAAFKVAMDGKQVALIAPTTILVEQHYQTFESRFQDYPINIEAISRFKTRKEQKEVIERLKSSGIDIIIGTHRLLQSDVVYHDLGLMIIDEEQRFGVSHKEKLKKMRSTIDVLTLTATPIPRTLNMTLMGIWDLSIIETPPQDRRSIETYILEFDEDVIRNAIQKEIGRGGKVFFVHNRVANIQSIYRFLTNLVPEARCLVAHGRLKSNQLEKVMFDFIWGDYNVLVSTTIIESGLDIPAANTIIVNHADKFGLGDIYQLRGRVGRSKEQAYAYLLTPKGKVITNDSKKRLEALREYSELGSAFQLALKDLEIRGAGNILGKSQSGHIAAIGYEMYIDLMEKEIKKIKGEKIGKEIEPEIEVNLSALLPEAYIPDTNQRLIIYKKLSSSKNEKEVAAIEEEIIDLYGGLPLQAKNLLEIIRTKILLKELVVKRLDYNGREVIISFDEETKIMPEKVVKLITQDKKGSRFSPDLKLYLSLENPSHPDFLKETRNFLKKLL